MKNKNKFLTGFTLIELIVVIGIIAILSAVILFSITQYINNGKDSSIKGNLVALIPAGETWYGINQNSYVDFCNPGVSNVFKNAISQMPANENGACSTNLPGVCCFVASNNQSWAACAMEFSKPNTAFCVDSRGVKEEMDTENYSCSDAGLTFGNSRQCPDLSTP